MDFMFATPDEIGRELARRLKAVRLARGIQQVDLARMAGVSAGTVKALENKGQSTLTTLVRVVQALGLTHDLEGAFALQIRSIADMERAQQATRKRAPRRPRTTGTTSGGSSP